VVQLLGRRGSRRHGDQRRRIPEPGLWGHFEVGRAGGRFYSRQFEGACFKQRRMTLEKSDWARAVNRRPAARFRSTPLMSHRAISMMANGKNDGRFAFGRELIPVLGRHLHQAELLTAPTLAAGFDGGVACQGPTFVRQSRVANSLTQSVARGLGPEDFIAQSERINCLKKN